MSQTDCWNDKHFIQTTRLSSVALKESAAHTLDFPTELRLANVSEVIESRDSFSSCSAETDQAVAERFSERREVDVVTPEMTQLRIS